MDASGRYEMHITKNLSQYSELHEYQHICISSIVGYEVIGGFKNVKNGNKGERLAWPGEIGE